jgi:hypothetical protein
VADLIIRLEVDPQTKKKTVWVKYDSDSDALPIEHEEEHKRLVEALLGKGIIGKGDKVVVEREAPARVDPAPSEASPQEPRKVAQKD